MVWPLGPELHLRNLVGAVCAQRRWRRSPGPDDAQGCGLAGVDPEQGWRLGRGCRQLSAGLQGVRGRAGDPLPNGRGVAWADGGRRRGGGGGFAGRGASKNETAWALLGLMAAGEVERPEVVRGVEYLKATQTEKGLWDEARYTATGFPRVFYLRYHGYSKFFPLWALARYRNLRSTNSRVVGVGM